MKKLTAAILALVLLFALCPAFASADNAFVLKINGGEATENTVTLNGETFLKVDLYLEGITDETLLASINFGLNYDPDQLSYYRNSHDFGVDYLYSVDGNGRESNNYMLLVNQHDEGEVLLAMATTYGCRIREGMPLISLYFRMNAPLRENDTIVFTATSGATVESITLANLQSGGKTQKGTLTTDFKPFTLSGINGTVEWNSSDVKFTGSTPYVLYNGQAKTPRFTVKDAFGNVIDASQYTYEFKENTQPGTGYLFVTFTNGYTGTIRATFKIYLPATTKTTVENVDNGIKVTWAPVTGAAGYVIYRRAWSSTTGGWTTFARWNNTTETTYIDGADAAHKVYAGTRYQYGIKAYFARRLDPIANTEIGGNVNEPSGNYNLGQVGPLKTTVRITTRTLNTVTGGSKQLTVKWAGSSNFTGYEVQIATDSGFTKNVKTVTISNAKTYQTTIKSLKSSTTYYVRVRSYHEFEGMTYYGGWSNVKSAKTK